MDELQKMLFLNQKFQILALYTSSAAENTVSESYVYAWSNGIFPVFNTSAEWHEPYEPFFSVSGAQVRSLHQYLADKWGAKTTPTFYELEYHYGVNGSATEGAEWDRKGLVSACRYLFLLGMFDTQFWSSLLENGKCPTEAHIISRSFDSAQIYFE